MNEKKQQIPTTNTIQTYNEPVKVPIKEIVDKESRIVFALGLISGIMATTSFSEGSILLMPNISMLESYVGSIITMTQVVALIVLLALHSTGLVLGIVGRVKSTKIVHENSFKNWGGIFSLLGIIANSIGLILAFIVFPLLLFNPPIYYPSY